MVELAGDRPVVLKEVGYPSSPLLGGSEHDQAQFVSNVFLAWCEEGEDIPFLSYFALHDNSSQLAEERVVYYGLDVDAEKLAALISSLGLRFADGTPKESWQVLVDEAARYGLPH